MPDFLGAVLSFDHQRSNVLLQITQVKRQQVICRVADFVSAHSIDAQHAVHWDCDETFFGELNIQRSILYDYLSMATRKNFNT